MQIRLDDIVKDKKTIGIGGHIRPDGDCVGSVLSVYNYIKTYYPEISVDAYLETIPNKFKFLMNSAVLKEPVESDKVYDLFICLDCSDIKRLGPSGKMFENAKKRLCIDHHLSNESFADINYIIPDESSTCELVFNSMDEDKITTDIATSLYLGIIHDTGVFRYDCTHFSTMVAAGKLMGKGINFPKLIDETFYQKTFNQNKVTGCALEKAKLYADGRIIASYITMEEMAKYDVLPRHLDGIVSELRDTKDAEVAIFLYELEKGSFKVSSRATADINLAEVASRHGGGGHAKAAGFEVFGEPEAAIQGIVDEITPLLI